jgi:hypothetical protein
MIENAYKNYNFCSLPEFFDFSLLMFRFFFPENFFTTITNKIKKGIMHIHHKKALLVFPEFCNFPGNFSNFSLRKNLIRIITNIKKTNLPNHSSRSYRKKHFQFFPNFPIFRATFPIFFSFLNHP